MTNKPTAKTDKKPATPDDILDETIKNTERQKQDTTFETQDRHLNAQFGVAKTLGQSSLTVMKLGSSIAGQRRQKNTGSRFNRPGHYFFNRYRIGTGFI
jgi:hypothetical protein